MQHLKSQKHVSNEKRFEEKKQRQLFISVETVTRSEKWCEALAKAGLPFNILANLELKGFLEAELGYKLPSETSVRKEYLETVVQTERKTMITELQGKDLYVIFDETAIENKQIFAVLVRDVMSPRNPYLLTILEGDRVDSGFVLSAIFKDFTKLLGTKFT